MKFAKILMIIPYDPTSTILAKSVSEFTVQKMEGLLRLNWGDENH
jgi:hypothetical protein